jgi:hypothetical protein
VGADPDRARARVVGHRARHLAPARDAARAAVDYHERRAEAESVARQIGDHGGQAAVYRCGGRVNGHRA